MTDQQPRSKRDKFRYVLLYIAWGQVPCIGKVDRLLRSCLIEGQRNGTGRGKVSDELVMRRM